MSSRPGFLLAVIGAAIVSVASEHSGAQEAAPPRTWVDPPSLPEPQRPPASTGPIRPPEPTPSPPVVAQPPVTAPLSRAPPPNITHPPPPRSDPDDTDDAAAVLSDAAKDFVVAYLAAWSSTNDDALAAMPSFYGRTVLFHGRTMSFEALMREKERFVRRWPSRTYEARPGTISAACDPGMGRCQVSLVVDFVAIAGARRSSGATTLDIGIETKDGRPVIATETSRVVARNRLDDDE